MREEGKVLELKLQLTETKLAEAERRVKQEAEGRRLLLASTAKENSIETPKFTSNIVGDNSLKRENEQVGGDCAMTRMRCAFVFFTGTWLCTRYSFGRKSKI